MLRLFTGFPFHAGHPERAPFLFIQLLWDYITIVCIREMNPLFRSAFPDKQIYPYFFLYVCLMNGLITTFL